MRDILGLILVYFPCELLCYMHVFPACVVEENGRRKMWGGGGNQEKEEEEKGGGEEHMAME